jgi:hypothetical protein
MHIRNGVKLTSLKSSDKPTTNLKDFVLAAGLVDAAAALGAMPSLGFRKVV